MSVCVCTSAVWVIQPSNRSRPSNQPTVRALSRILNEPIFFLFSVVVAAAATLLFLCIIYSLLARHKTLMRMRMLTRYKASIMRVHTHKKKRREEKNLCVTKVKLYFHNASCSFHLIFGRCWIEQQYQYPVRNDKDSQHSEPKRKKQQRKNDSTKWVYLMHGTYHITDSNKFRNVQVRPTVRPTFNPLE